MRERELSADDAAALLRPSDTLAMPLGPGIPGGFMHALGRRDDWQALEVFGALLLDFFTVFTKPGVRLRSGFFGPAERAHCATRARRSSSSPPTSAAS